jgi:hypothetical protein
MSELLQALGIIGVTLIGLAGFPFVLKAWSKDEFFGFISLIFMLCLWIFCVCVIGDLGR